MKGTSAFLVAGLASAVGAARIAGGSPCSSHPPTATTSVPGPTDPAGPKYFITFGDSYSQSGFSFSGTKPTAENPLGNPPLPGWTASGGLGWVAFAATEYNNDVLLSYNVAYGGATTAADLVTPYAPEVLSFEDQVDLFSANLAVEPHPSWAPWAADDTLVGVWIGVNDVGNTFWFSDIQQRYETIMERYFGLLQTVYDAGARQFVLLSVPPTWKTPAFLAQGQTATGPVATAINLYNDLLEEHLAAFKAANSDATTWLVDTSVPFDKALNNPTAYGSPDALCYNEDGTSCLWFNDYHPGVAIQKLVAEEVAKVVGAPFFEI
ncbi:hypothetical protein ACHAQA_000034 [Verticillium albo-atrum]